MVSFRNEEILKLLTDMWVKNLSGPSIRELATAIGFKSANSAVHHLERLVDEGLVERLESGGSKSYIPVAWKRRLLACINACDGISTEELESRHRTMSKL